MKKIMMGLLLLYSLIMFAVPASAKEIKPQKGCDVQFNKLTYINDGNVEHVKIEGSKKANGILEAYHIQIDPKKGTYITTKKDPKDMNNVEPIQSESSKSEDEKNSTNSINTLDSDTYYYGWVKAVTDDPAGVDLCYTKVRLDWIDHGELISFDEAALNLWAANPSSLGTHWYIDDNDFYYDDDDNVYSLDAEGTADFHNYDFGDDDDITRVTHEVSMTAQNDATYDYDVDWSRSGECYYLLDLDVYLN